MFHTFIPEHGNARSDSVVDDVFEMDPFNDSDGESNPNQPDIDDEGDDVPNYLTRTADSRLLINLMLFS